MSQVVKSANAAPGRCSQITEDYQTRVLSTTPARICSIEIRTTAAGGWVYVFDGLTTTDAQRKGIAEPGNTASGGHEVIYFGPEGYVTGNGLVVDASNARYFIQWGN